MISMLVNCTNHVVTCYACDTGHIVKQHCDSVRGVSWAKSSQMRTAKCWLVQKMRANIGKIGVQRIPDILKFSCFLQLWTLNFLKLVSATRTKEIVICHIALVAGVLGSEKNAVDNVELFV